MPMAVTRMYQSSVSASSSFLAVTLEAVLDWLWRLGGADWAVICPEPGAEQTIIVGAAGLV
jgi:hypothetical protein